MIQMQPTVVTKVDRMFRQKNKTVLSDHFAKLTERDGGEDDDDILVLSRRNHDLDEVPQAESNKPQPIDISKRKLQKLKQKALEQRGSSQKFVYNEDGEVSLLMLRRRRVILC